MRRVILTSWFSIGFLILGCSPDSNKLSLFASKNNPDRKNFEITTKDGWTLNIWRYKPKQIKPNTLPVILCHGLSYNSFFWDLTEKTSLARYLQSAGYDVWSVDLRGAGLSSKPALSEIKQLFRLNISLINPVNIKNAPADLLKLNWTVDDHINYDIPAILDFVTEKTGKDKVVWIGHSMGAMIMFGYLGKHPDDNRVAGFVAVAGPMYLVRPVNDIFEMMVKQKDFVKIGNITTGANLRAVVGTLTGGLVETAIDALFYNEKNIDAETFHMLFYLCQEDISPGQLDQLIQFLRKGHFVSVDEKIDYTENVSKIQIPILQIVGQLDNMASPGFVLYIHNKLKSKDKTFRLFGRINGYRADYGHDDIIIGKYSKEEVFPYVLNWLDKHSYSTSNLYTK